MTVPAMKTEPLISLIVPYYNAGNYLKRCVDSITGQSCRRLEILLVDDGSEDASPEEARRLAEADSRIRCIRIPHGGVSAARNAGLEQASGPYIMFADSDDWLVDGILEKMLTRMEETGADLVTCDLVRTDSPDFVPKPGTGQEEICTQEEYMRLFFRIGSNEWVHYPVAKLYRKELLPQPLFPGGIRIGEDVVGTYLALSQVRSILRIREIGYCYFTNPDSATGCFSERDFDLIKVWDQVVQDAGDKEPDAAYAKLNRDRLNFTLLFRLITEVSRKERRQKYAREEKQLRSQLHACEKELLAAPIVLSRKALILLLCHAYPAASGLGDLSVRIRTGRGKQTGFFRRN
jgi:glycosyltransferase involved in cell wall biosynthesis